MVKHTRQLMIAIAALAALALGGATFAQAGSSPSKPAQLKHTKVHAKVQAKAKAKAHTKAKTHARAAQATGSETPGAETPDGAAETPDAAEAPNGQEAAGSEVPNNDGPGGHADEPGNPTADHQFQGEE